MFRSRALLLVTALFGVTGCTQLSTRFPANVSEGFNRGPMREMETRALRIYYPEERRGEVLRMASRLEACVDLLTEQAGVRREKMVIFVTRSNFNNAYVQSLSPGQPQQMVLPEHTTSELFNWFQMGPGEMRNVACHEAVHYVQLQQVDGLFRVLNDLTGGLLQPNIFTESWFLEGLATWYEGNLGEHVGRPNSPIFRGYWEAGVESEGGRMHPGYLHSAHRKTLPFGGAYQTGAYFVDWLVRTHGEEKLWELVQNVGGGVTLFVGVNLRFRHVYGKGIGALWSDFTDELASRPERIRPEGQQTLRRDLGYVARLASAPDGTLALITQHRGEVSTLRVLEADGTERFSRPLRYLLPGRPHIAAAPLSFSGLRFSQDAGALYAVLGDVDVNGNEDSRLVKLSARTGEVEQQWKGLMGMGGDLTPREDGYVHVHVTSDTSQLMHLDLLTGETRLLTAFPPNTSLGPPSVDATGRIAFPRWGPEGFDLWLLEPGAAPRALTEDAAFDYAPRWLVDGRLLFMREHEGRAQAAVMDVETGRWEIVSDAPHLVMDPVPTGDGRIAFLNREAWSFSLDTLGLSDAAPAQPEEALATAVEQENVDADDALAAAPEDAALEPEAEASTPEDDTASELALADEDPDTTPADELPPEVSGPSTTDLDALVEAWSRHRTSGLSLFLTDPRVSDNAGVEVLRDAPYRWWDDLFLPQLRAPTAAFNLTGGSTDVEQLRARLGFGLQGADRLGRHNWVINAYYDTLEKQVGGTVGYVNHQLAPWTVWGTLTRTPLAPRTDWSVRLNASRTFWTTPVSFSMLGFHRTSRSDDGPWTLGLIGPRVAADYFAGDATLDGGTQRGFGLSVATGVYGARQGGIGAPDVSLTITDVRAGVTAYLPFFELGNDSFLLSATGRILADAPRGLLRVGGGAGGYSNLDLGEPGRQYELPYPVIGPLTFWEPVRGYEDVELAATRFAHLHGRYRQTFVIDHGWASFLWIFPSFFVRQVDVDLFGSIFGTDGVTTLHRVAGASTRVHTLFSGYVPVSLGYQFSWRFDDGLPPLHLVTFSL